MARKLIYLVGLVTLIALALGLVAASPNAPATNAVILVSPSTWPKLGFAAGQRLNMQADFNLSIFDPNLSPNVQICVFSPTNWSVTGFTPGTKGGVSNVSYSDSKTNCEKEPAPNLYYLMGGAYATLPAGTFGDSFTFAFRLGIDAKVSGSILVRVLEQNSPGTWIDTGQTFSPIPVTATGSNVYVANDATACSENSPCYVNSGDDTAGGIGTGLKDAIDSSQSASAITINVLGSYLIKNNAVLLDEPHLVTGANNASLGYQGGDCSQPMLYITAGATVSNLTISSASCAASNRNLVRIESTSPVTLEGNDLTNGKDALQVGPANVAPVEVRYNNIQFNSGYGIYFSPPDSPSTSPLLDAVANNISDNRKGAQVECNGADNGVVDHNFWGAQSTSLAISQCTFDDTKRLGAAIQDNPSGPGVNAQLVSANTTLSYAFNNQVGYQLTGGDTSLDLYVVNHGAGSPNNIPFTGGQPGNVIPCSNFWDVFLADSTAPASTDVLTLHFKYNLSSDCISTIASTRFCNQTTDSSQYPLYWYEIYGNTWATTGQTGGQPTTCNLDQNEIQVAIDASAGRPDFIDLERAPFVVGLPGTPSMVVISSFTGQPGSQLVTLDWTTSSEVNTKGFIVMRSTQQDTGFSPISDLIAHTGTNLTGASYEYVDQSNLVNGTTYYYRLQVVNFDLTTMLTGTVSVTPIPATSTPTPTPTITPTITRTSPPATPTKTRTKYPTSTYIYKSLTPTRTATPTPTSPFQTVTNTPSVTITPTLTASSNVTATLTPGSANTTVSPSPGAATQLAFIRETRTALARLSETPTPVVTPDKKPSTPSLTTVLAVLALVLAGAGLLIYFLRDRLKLST